MRRINKGWRRQAGLQALLGVSLSALIVLLFAIDLKLRHDAAIAQGMKSAHNFAEVVSEHTALTFDNVELTLRAAEKIRKDSLAGDYPTPEDTNAALRLLMKTSPVIVAVGWTDKDGNVVAHSYDSPLPRSSIAQMAHFTVHRDNAGDQLYVSPPFQSAVSNQWFTAASLRLNNDDGSFAGVVTAPLDQSYFAKIYRSIDLGNTGSILLVHTDGLILARQPVVEGVAGRSIAEGPLLTQHLPRSSTGAYEVPNASDGQPRIAGYKVVRDLPLVLSVSYARSEVLRAWNRHVTLFGPLVALVVTAILIGTLLIVKQTRSLAQKSAALLTKSDELERINQRFDMALSQMPNGLVMWGPDQRIVIANDRYRAMYGLTAEQAARGVSLRQILEVHKTNGEKSELAIDDFIKVIAAQREQVHVLADGRIIAMRRQPTPDGGWIATHQDITEHKRAETLLRATLDTMDQGLIALDRDGRATLMNTRVLDLLGLPRAFAASRPHKREILEYQRSIGEFSSDELYDQVVKDIDERRHTIYERERPNGTVLEIRTVPTEDGGLVRTYTDITARRTAEAALRMERDRAEAAARAKAEFLANMSHELRTPLTAIIGVSEMLLGTPQSPDRQRRFIEMQRNAGKGLLDVISDILDFSRMEAGQLTLEKSPFSLNELANGCLEVIAEQAERKGIDLAASVATDVGDWVLGDAGRLRQVLLNLISNALKFTPSGTVRLAIQRVAGAPDAIRFAVTDTGIGMSESDMATLFQRFAQADSSTTRRFGGSGLGLAISQQLVTLMGGRIEVESAPGRGSAFSFVIDLPPTVQNEAQPAAALPANAMPCHLLLAEDNPVNRELIKAMLEQAGHRVTTVNDGAEAVRVAMRQAFDAILMDVQMPEMDGYTAARSIRDAPGNAAQIPIIALTANALPGESERCFAAGMNAHIAKPVNWPILFAAIEGLVRKSRQDNLSRAEEADRLARPPSPLSADFDTATLSHLRATIGEANAAKLLRLFAADARQRFVTRPVSAGEREAARHEAHTFGGSAGMLGFHELAESCRALEAAGDDDAVFSAALERCRVARTHALGLVAKLLGDDADVQPGTVAS